MQQAEKENLIKLAKRIKSLRLNKAVSLNKLVLNKGGVTTATWSRIENAKVDIKFNTLIKIAAILDITVDELIKDLDFDYSLSEE